MRNRELQLHADDPTDAAHPSWDNSLLSDHVNFTRFGQCDQRVIDRLRKECLRDGGRP